MSAWPRKDVASTLDANSDFINCQSLNRASCFLCLKPSTASPCRPRTVRPAGFMSDGKLSRKRIRFRFADLPMSFGRSATPSLADLCQACDPVVGKYLGTMIPSHIVSPISERAITFQINSLWLYVSGYTTSATSRQVHALKFGESYVLATQCVSWHTVTRLRCCCGT